MVSDHYSGAELDGKSISIQHASSAGGPALARRIGGFKERDDRRERDYRDQRDYRDNRRDTRPRGRGGNFRNNRGDRGFNKRRFNDRVRDQRSYRDRR
jgi:hypothetical protein